MTRRSLLKALAAVVAVTPGLKLLTCQHEVFVYELGSGDLTSICLKCDRGWWWHAERSKWLDSTRNETAWLKKIRKRALQHYRYRQGTS